MNAHVLIFFLFFCLKKQMKELRPFHLAIPVSNLKECRTFYSEVLMLKEGRSSDNWS